MTSAAPALAALPADVFARTFAFVDRRSLAAAVFTCRRWRDIMQHEGFWRSILAAQYPRVEAAAWRVLPSSPLAALSDEALARIVSYFDADGFAAFANACRGDGSVTIWRALLLTTAARRPRPYWWPAFAASSTEGGWRGLFLHTERLVAQFEDRLNGGLAEFVEGIRDGTELYGLSDCRYCLGDRLSTPLPSPGQGTTARANEAPDASGAYSSPVYYDWGANLELVKELVPTPVVQAVLEGCVNEAFGIDAWDDGKVWPFFCNERQARCEDGVQDQLMRLFLPLEHVRELNGRYADWFRSRGEAIFTEEHDPVSWIRGGLETGGDISEEGFVKDIEDGMRDNIIDRLHYCFDQEAAGGELQAIAEASERVLYREDSSVDETLLCVPNNSWQAFLPLNYILARLLSPEDAQLRVYVSSHYGVVIDERRNILFDNCAYFGEMPASDILERSMGPQLPPANFDYSLGGLVTP